MFCDWAAVRQMMASGGVGLEINRRLDRFLSNVERRAWCMAAISTGNTEEALDIVQDAVMRFVTRYAQRDEADWGPLFQRILQNAVTDWHRRSRVRNRWHRPMGQGEADTDRIQAVADPLAREPGEILQGGETLGRLERGLSASPPAPAAGLHVASVGRTERGADRVCHGVYTG